MTVGVKQNYTYRKKIMKLKEIELIKRNVAVT